VLHDTRKSKVTWLPLLFSCCPWLSWVCCILVCAVSTDTAVHFKVYWKKNQFIIYYTITHFQFQFHYNCGLKAIQSANRMDL
jgi:hypothetical protein